MREMGNDDYVYKQARQRRVRPLADLADQVKRPVQEELRVLDAQPQPPEHEGAKSSFVASRRLKFVGYARHKSNGSVQYLSLWHFGE